MSTSSYRYKPYNAGNELQQVLSSVVVAAGGDRGTIYRYDNHKQSFVRSDDEYVAINTPNKNTAYLSEYSFDPETKTITGLCNFYETGKNVATEEGQALYIPIESKQGQKLLVIVEREYIRGENGKLYLAEEYNQSGPKTEVTEREFHPSNINTAAYIAKTWNSFLFPDAAHADDRKEFLADMNSASSYLSIISNLTEHVKERFGYEMKSHVNNVGRMAKMAIMDIVKSPEGLDTFEGLQRRSITRLLPARLIANLTNMDILYNQWVLHDAGKINNPRKETKWLGHKKSAGESIRSKQHGLFTEILLTLPGLHYGKDVGNHHTDRGYYNDYSMISAFVEIADTFDAMTGSRRNERYRPQTAIEAMTAMAERIIEFDEELQKYNPTEAPDLDIDKKEVKIPRQAVALMAKAFEAFLEHDIFKTYPKSRNGDFSSWFNDPKEDSGQEGSIAQAWEETRGMMFDKRHTLEHLRENGGYTNNISRIARRAQIVTGQHKYDQNLSPHLQRQQPPPDTYEEIKVKILHYLRDKILNRPEIGALLEQEARKIKGPDPQKAFQWAR